MINYSRALEIPLSIENNMNTNDVHGYDLSDGEVLDIIFDKFGISEDRHINNEMHLSKTQLIVPNVTERLLQKIDKLLENRE